MLPRFLLAADDALLDPARLVRGNKGHVHLYLGEQPLPAHFPEAVIIGRSHPHRPAVHGRRDEEVPGAAGLVPGRGDVDGMADHVVQGEGDQLGGPSKEGTDGLLALVDPEVAAPIPDGIVREERGEAIGVLLGVTKPSVAYLEPPNVFNVLKPLDAFLKSGHHALLITSPTTMRKKLT
jgi:hypothetical protein